MESLAAKFIKEFSLLFGKYVNFKSSKEVKIYILNLLKSNLGIKSSNISDNSEFICNILFETDYDNKALLEEKRNIIMNLISGKRNNINDIKKKLISVIDKEVIVVREKIMKIIKYETNDTSINIDPLNEITFFTIIK